MQILFKRILLILLFSSIFINASQKQTPINISLSLISAMSETIHSLQQERGASCGYISSNGNKFHKKLSSIKIKSNHNLKNLQDILNKNKDILKRYLSNKQHNILDKTFKEIITTRDDIKNLKIDFTKVYSKYTQSIALILLNISNISDKLENKELSDKLYIYSVFLMYKESIGQKRASLSSLFSKKDFTKEIFEYFLTSDTQEKIYLNSFLHSINKKDKEFYKKTLNHSTIETVKLYEKLAYDKLSGKIVDVDPQDWFVNITKKIDLIQEVEYKIFEEIFTISNNNDKNSLITLTKEEMSWIKNHPIVTVGVEMDWAPFAFVNESNHYMGLTKDYLDIIEKKTSLKFKYDIGKGWAQLLDAVKDGTIDILPALMKTKTREKFMLFTDSYLNYADYFFTTTNSNNIKEIEELYGKTVAVIKGYETIDWLKKNHPQVKMIVKSTLLECLLSVESQESDCFIGDNPSASYAINTNMLSNIRINGIVKGRPHVVMHMGVRKEKDYKMLTDIISKALNSIKREERNIIASRWMNIANKVNLVFNKKEQNWLDKKQSITYVYDPDWAPFEWTNELEQHTGIIADILKIISQSTSIEFIPANTKTWSDSVKKMKDKSVDMYSAVVENEKRKEYIKFTSKNIYSAPGVIVSRTDDDTVYIDIKTAIKDKKIGIVKNNSMFEFMKKTYPKTNFIAVDSNSDGFEKLKNKQIDIFILNAVTAQYFIKQKGYSSTRIATKIDFSFDLKIAIQKTMPKEVLSILNKAIDNISEKELNAIYHKWTHISVETKTDWILISKVSSGILLIILFILWNNYKLKSTVKAKTKDLQNVLDSMEITIKDRTQELNDEKNFINTIIDSQENFVITSDGKYLKTANKAFYTFYKVKDTTEFINTFGSCICDTFNTNDKKGYIQKYMGDELWLDYVNKRPNKIHKTLIVKDDINYIFTITSEKLIINGAELKTAIFTDITVLENYSNEILEIHKHTRDSIEYASLIQGALIPDANLFDNYFKASFIIWHPKDIVGGDIYLFEELRDKNECLLMCIDCTGHGVPGAFVTMLVKAIERQIIAKIEHDKDNNIEISPAWILGYFNKKMKQLLKQDNKNSLSNAGFDGGIIYYNKKEQIIKFSGAETPLFYFTQSGEFTTIKGSRHSVGYKKCKVGFQYDEHIIKVQDGMKFYITTDGYLDQNGGEKDFPFGKKRFTSIIKKHEKEPLAKLESILLKEMIDYESMVKNNDRNDDITVIGFEIKDNEVDTILE